jgi:hypothetical protein
MGDLVLDLLTGFLAPTIYDNCGIGMRRFNVFCDEEGITPIHDTAVDMLRYRLARPITDSRGHKPPNLLLNNQLSTINNGFSETTLRSHWRWDHF